MREAVDYLVGEEGLPIKRACAHLGYLGHPIISVLQIKLRQMRP